MGSLGSSLSVLTLDFARVEDCKRQQAAAITEEFMEIMFGRASQILNTCKMTYSDTSYKYYYYEWTSQK